MVAAVTAIAAAVLGAAAGPASASARRLPVEWIVSGNTNADGHYIGSGTGFTFRDTASGVTIGCSTSTVQGIIRNGTHTTGAGLATITSTAYNTCTMATGLTFTVAHSGTWLFNALAYTPGVTTGTISNIAASLSGPSCSAKLTGSVPVTYANANHRFTISPTGTALHFSGVSGCFGLINNGDVVVINGFWVWVPPILIVDP
jgi:hypothetical protein